MQWSRNIKHLTLNKMFADQELFSIQSKVVYLINIQLKQVFILREGIYLYRLINPIPKVLLLGHFLVPQTYLIFFYQWGIQLLWIVSWQCLFIVALEHARDCWYKSIYVTNLLCSGAILCKFWSIRDGASKSHIYQVDFTSLVYQLVFFPFFKKK